MPVEAHIEGHRYNPIEDAPSYVSQSRKYAKEAMRQVSVQVQYYNNLPAQTMLVAVSGIVWIVSGIHERNLWLASDHEIQLDTLLAGSLLKRRQH
jgi:hypothetical protein